MLPLLLLMLPRRSSPSCKLTRAPSDRSEQLPAPALLLKLPRLKADVPPCAPLLPAPSPSLPVLAGLVASCRATRAAYVPCAVSRSS